MGRKYIKPKKLEKEVISMKTAGVNLVHAEKCGLDKERTENRRRYGKFFSEDQYSDVAGYGACSAGSCNDSCTDGD